MNLTEWTEECIYEFPLPWAGQAGSVGGGGPLYLGSVCWHSRRSWCRVGFHGGLATFVWHRDLE